MLFINGVHYKSQERGEEGKGCVGGDGGVCQGGESGKMNGSGKMRGAEGEKGKGKGGGRGGGRGDGRGGEGEGESVNRQGAGFFKAAKTLKGSR
jgi:hypothetical protein